MKKRKAFLIQSERKMQNAESGKAELTGRKGALLFFLSIFFNFLSVLLHEFGHAIVYLIQGYQVEYHFTKMDPVNGIQTLVGASGGILSNAIFSIVALVLFLRFGTMVFYLLVAANTLFCRVLVGVLFILSGKTLADEAYIGTCLSMSPALVQTIVVAALFAVFACSTIALFLKRGKKYSLGALGTILLSDLLSLVVLIYMDEHQI
jgi:hypothetical protein